MKKLSPLEVVFKRRKIVSGKARLNDMCRAYMEPKQRSRTHVLCLLTVFIVNGGYFNIIYYMCIIKIYLNKN